MSLAVLADHLASKGRGDDKMLVHMTPGEVQGLQALALAHGGSLTINPETGLVEAGWLKSLLPAIAGMALNFIAPGVGTAIGGMLGVSGAIGTGIAVGGITGLATGSLKQGIMAGLGAYGGASLAGGLMSASGAEGVAGALGVPGAATSAGSQAAMLAEQTAGFGGEGLQKLAESAGYAKGAAPSLAPSFMAGVKGLGTEAGRAAFMQGVGGASGLMRAGMAAAAPVVADQMVPTTTGMPAGSGFQYTPRIRPMAYNQYTGGLEQLPMFSAINRAGTTQTPAPAPAPAQPEAQPSGGYNAGGIVALAAGGFTKPTPDEFMKKTGADFQTAADLLYGVVGSNQERRNWDAIMAAQDPIAAARQATAAMYGGIQQGQIVTPGATPEASTVTPMLFGADNLKLTSQTGRAQNFGMGLTGGQEYLLTPDQIAAMNRPAAPAPAAASQPSTDPTQQATPTAAQYAAQQSIVNDPQAAALAAARSGVAAGMTNQQIADMVNTQYGKSFSAQNVADFMAANNITRPVASTPPAPNPFAAQITAGEKAIPYASGARATDEELRQIYRDLLGREADPGGFEFYKASQWSPEQIRREIMNSIEYKTRPVKPVGVTSTPFEPTTPAGVTPGTSFGGGTLPEYTAPQPQVTLGEAFKPTAQTMSQVRSAYEQGGGSTTMPTITDIKPGERTYTQNEVANILTGYLQANPNAQYSEVKKFAASKGIPEMQARAAYNEFRFASMTGGSKSAYDYMMGRGAYPVNQVLPGNAPLMKPYLEASGISRAGDFFGRKTIPTTPSRQTALSAGNTPTTGDGPTGSTATTGGGTATTGGGGTTFVGGAGTTMGSTNTGPIGTVRNTETGDFYTPVSGTPITDFLFGTQDASTVPVEDRSIYTDSYLQERGDQILKDMRDSDALERLLAEDAAARDANRAEQERLLEEAIQRQRDLIESLDKTSYYDYGQGYDYNPGYDYDVGEGYYSGGGRYTREELDALAGLKKGGLADVAAAAAARGGNVQQYNLGGYSDGGRLLRGPGDGVSDSIPATIGNKQPARLADGEFVIPARIVSEIGNGSTEAGARKLYAMMDRVQRARAKTTGKGKVAKNTNADKYLPA